MKYPRVTQRSSGCSAVPTVRRTRLVAPSAPIRKSDCRVLSRAESRHPRAVGSILVIRVFTIETPAFSDPNLLAAIFAPPPAKPAPDFTPPLEVSRAELPYARHEFHLPYVKRPIPETWDAFEKQAGREMTLMFKWLEEVGYHVDIPVIRQEYANLTGFERWLQSNWAKAFAA